MKAYRDKKIEIADNRLTDFDIGYVMAPLTVLTLEKANVYSYSERLIVRKLTNIANSVSSHLSILLVSKYLEYAPILLAYLIRDISRVAFFLGQPISNVKVNLLTQDLARTITYMQDKDLSKLVQACVGHGSPILAVVDGSEREILQKLLPEVGNGKIKLLLMPDYASKANKTLYFDFQKVGYTAIEYQDGLGEIMTFKPT